MAQTLDFGYPGVLAAQTSRMAGEPLLKRESPIGTHSWPQQSVRPNGQPSLSISGPTSSSGTVPLHEQLWSAAEGSRWGGQTTAPSFMTSFRQGLDQKCDLDFEDIAIGTSLSIQGSFGYGGDKSWTPCDVSGLPNSLRLAGGYDGDANSDPSSPGSYWSDLTDHGGALDCEQPIGQSSPGAVWIDNRTNPYPGLERSNAHDGRVSLPGSDPRLHIFDQGVAVANQATFQQNRFSMVPLYMNKDQVWDQENTNMALRVAPVSDNIEWVFPTHQNAVVDAQGSGSSLYDMHRNSQGFTTISFQQAQITALQQPNGNHSAPESLGQTAEEVQDTCSEAQAYPDEEVDNEPRLFRSTNARRRLEDSILIEGKRAGLTYKEIKKRIPSKVAESTLRGRYRSLTKARKDRVRKPVWQDKDVRLLRRVVSEELDKFNDACYRELTRSQKLAKLSWKRVAEYIASHGGSYHFGNSTCKKKWSEIDS